MSSFDDIPGMEEPNDISKPFKPPVSAVPAVRKPAQVNAFDSIGDTASEINTVQPGIFAGMKQGAVNAAKELPVMAGAVIGGIAGTPAGPLGMAGGAMVGGAAGKSLQNIGESAYNLIKGKPVTPAAEQINAITTAGQQGAMQEMLGPIAGKVIPAGVKAAGQGISAVKKGAGKVIEEAGEWLARLGAKEGEIPLKGSRPPMYKTPPDVRVKLQQALKPSVKQDEFLRNLDTAYPEIVTVAKKMGKEINNIDDLLEVIHLSKNNAWSQYMQIIEDASKPQMVNAPAGTRLAQTWNAETKTWEHAPKKIPEVFLIKGDDVVAKINKAIAPYYKDLEPETAAKIMTFAERYKGKMLTPQAAQEYLATVNAELAPYYRQEKFGQAVDWNDPKIRARLMESKALTDALDETVERSAAGMGDIGQKFRRLWGALHNIDKIASKRATVAGRQSSVSLQEGINKVSGAADIAGGAIRTMTGGGIEGVPQMARGAGKIGLSQMVKEANSTNGLIKQVFGPAGFKYNAAAPAAGRTAGIAIPEGNRTELEQIIAPNVPGIDTSKNSELQLPNKNKLQYGNVPPENAAQFATGTAGRLLSAPYRIAGSIAAIPYTTTKAALFPNSDENKIVNDIVLNTLPNEIAQYIVGNKTIGDTIAKYWHDTYGTTENLLKTIRNNPEQPLIDVSMALGVGKLANKGVLKYEGSAFYKNAQRKAFGNIVNEGEQVGGQGGQVLLPGGKKLSDEIYWHGSASGDLRGGKTGLHLGTKKAATQALEARIGVPAKGEWDGTRKYSETLLMGSDNLAKLEAQGIFKISGFNARDIPKEDYYAKDLPKSKLEENLKYPDGTMMPMDVMPNVKPYNIIGPINNTPETAYEDFKANGYMAGSIKKGNAKAGYFYNNVGEDNTFPSIVVPNGKHLQEIKNSQKGNVLLPGKPQFQSVLTAQEKQLSYREQVAALKAKQLPPEQLGREIKNISAFDNQPKIAKGPRIKPNLPAVIAPPKTLLRPGSKPGEIPYSSKLENTVAQMKDENIPVSQVREILNAAKVKKAEWEWANLEDYLSGKTTVNGKELLKHVQENNAPQLTVHEMTEAGVKGKSRYMSNDIRENLERLRDMAAEGTADEGFELTLEPEMLVMEIADNPAIKQDISVRFPELMLEHKDDWAEIVAEDIIATEGAKRSEGATKFKGYLESGSDKLTGTNYRELTFNLPSNKPEPNWDSYTWKRLPGDDAPSATNNTVYWQIYNAGKKEGTIYSTESELPGRIRMTRTPSNQDAIEGKKGKSEYYTETMHNFFLEKGLTGGAPVDEIAMALANAALDSPVVQEILTLHPELEENSNAAQIIAYDIVNAKKVYGKDHKITDVHGYGRDETDVNRVANALIEDQQIGKNKLLHINEMQSNWNQEGREKGWEIPKRNFTPTEQAEYDKLNQVFIDGAATDAQNERGLELNKIKFGGKGTPSNPYVKDWQKVAFKELVRKAYSEGYDGISWSTPETIGKRWHASRAIDHLDWSATPYDDGGKQVTLYLADAKGVLSVKIDPKGKIVKGIDGDEQLLAGVLNKHISEVAGEGMAKRILSEGTGEINDAKKIPLETWPSVVYKKNPEDYAKALGFKVEEGVFDSEKKAAAPKQLFTIEKIPGGPTASGRAQPYYIVKDSSGRPAGSQWRTYDAAKESIGNLDGVHMPKFEIKKEPNYSKHYENSFWYVIYKDGAKHIEYDKKSSAEAYVKLLKDEVIKQTIANPPQKHQHILFKNGPIDRLKEQGIPIAYRKQKMPKTFENA